MNDPADFARLAAEGASIIEAEPPLGEGEDDPLILWFLSLTPIQRLEVAQDFVDSARMLKNGFRS
jgi:hypothetical protein